MTTWIVGDIHGCARELERLIETLQLAPSDQLVCTGDLFHRGPDPLGVARLLEAVGARFVLGNHEHRLLERQARGADEASAEGALAEGAFEGDGGAACTLAHPEDGRELLALLGRHDGYALEHARLPAAGPTADGRPWLVVHAGIDPARTPADTPPETLMYTRRLARPGAPWWYEAHDGPTLVLFGHTPSPRPRSRFHRGRLVALGLDTGCVYGGRLTAYSPELDALESVPAERAYAA